jgi:Alr-MurF fusion protein
MVMSPDNEDFPRLINNDLEPEIYSLNTLKNFIRVAETMQVAQHPVHLKMDTGMHRLGFQESDIAELIHILQSTRTISVKGVFSHLAASDSPTHDDFSRKQISMFEKMYNQISNALSISPKRHILNTAGIERFPEAHFELIRLGIGLHGISTQSDLLPVSSLKTHISQIKKIPSGETIGYNRRGKAYKKMEIAIIPIGYADGLDRKFGNGTGQVIINNKKAPFVGDICMDMSMIDISDISCQEGDEVTLFSSEHPITLLAEQIDTIPYEILTNVSSRVKRVYIKE